MYFIALNIKDLIRRSDERRYYAFLYIQKTVSLLFRINISFGFVLFL